MKKSYNNLYLYDEEHGALNT